MKDTIDEFPGIHASSTKDRFTSSTHVSPLKLEMKAVEHLALVTAPLEQKLQLA